MVVAVQVVAETGLSVRGPGTTSSSNYVQMLGLDHIVHVCSQVCVLRNASLDAPERDA